MREGESRLKGEDTSIRRMLGAALKISVTVLVLAVIVWKLDLEDSVRVLSSLSGIAATLGVAMVLAQALVASQRIALIAARFGASVSRSSLFRITLESMFFSQTFVSFLGGDTLRVWRLRQSGLSLTDATSAVTLDRFIGIVVNHVFLLASLPWLLLHVREASVKYVAILLAVVGTVGFFFVLSLGFMRGRNGNLHRMRLRVASSGIGVLLVEASTIGRYFFLEPQMVFAASALSLLIVLANVCIFVVILVGLGVDPPAALACALLVPAILEIAMLPISIAGWGIREAATIVAFGSIGVSANQAFGASFTFGLSIVGVSLIGGGLWLIDRGKQPPVMVASEASSTPPAAE
jgi:hypothetical protein